MVGNWFLRFGALFGLATQCLVAYMAYQHDTKYTEVANQLNNIGWIGMVLAGLYYCSISTTSEYVETVGSLLSRSAGFHFFVALIGTLAICAGSLGTLFDLTYSGTIGGQVFDHFVWGDKLSLAGLITTAFAQLIFLLNVLRGTGR
jgi:hypothetical protein